MNRITVTTFGLLMGLSLAASADAQCAMGGCAKGGCAKGTAKGRGTGKFKVGEAGGMKVAQTAVFASDADFENFTGQTHGVTGTLFFDPATKTGSGKVVVDLGGLDTGIPMRNEHLRSEMWLNTGKFPQAVFETTKVKHRSGDEFDVEGKLTIHGVTRTVNARAKVRYMPESDATKKAMFMGDVLNVKTSFKIKLSDYGVKIPEMAAGKVSNEVGITLNVFGYTG